MLHEMLSAERIQVAGPKTWEEAIHQAGQPLLKDGSIRESYIEQILENVRQPGGTYMDLGFGITLAHARPEAGVERTGVALLILTEPVMLADQPEHPVRVVIFLAAHDATSHQEMLRELARFLMNPTQREAVIAARTPDVARAALTPE